MFLPFAKSKGVIHALIAKAIACHKSNTKSLSIRLREQADVYRELGLYSDRNEIQERLDQCLREAGFPLYTEGHGMYSEHLMLFSALSMSEVFDPINILEIGTYDGRTACVLSLLFPRATVTTIDLMDDDPIFANSYGRKKHDVRQRFIADRNNNLAKGGKNVNFVQRNSLFLSRQASCEYDLIWLDGAHGYPVACCDITNSIRLLSDSGVLMCDDVWTRISKSDKMYSSIATWETLCEYDNARITLTRLLRKRLGRRYLASEKYVSFTTLR